MVLKIPINLRQLFKFKNNRKLRFMFDKKRCEEILEMIKKIKAKKILIQIPEGLKRSATDLIDFLEKNNIECLLSIEPCFGACDLRDKEAKILGCDALLHIGHADFGLKTEVPTIFYEYYIDFDFINLLKNFIKKLNYKKFCLVTTIQFKNNLKKVKDFLEKNGFEIKAYDYILGCDISRVKKLEKSIDAYLFLGSGRFHPLGLQEKVGKPVLFLDVENQTLENLYKEKEKIEIKKRLKIEKAKSYRNFGIIISLKPGQRKVKEAEKIKKMLLGMGKNAYILIVDQLTPEKILGLKIDVLINTACPRISEDAQQYGKIILNPDEVEMLKE